MSGQVDAQKKSHSCLEVMDYDLHACHVRVRVMHSSEIIQGYGLDACQVSICGTAASDAHSASRKSGAHCVAGWMLMPLLCATHIQAINWVKHGMFAKLQGI